MEPNSDASTRTDLRARRGRRVGDRRDRALTPGVRDRIAGYRPRGEVRPEILEWTRSTVLAFRPTETTVTSTCTHLYGFGRWLWHHGYDLGASHADLLSPVLIDAYLASRKAGLTPSTQTAVRSTLHQIRRALVAETKFQLAGSRTDVDGAVSPYTPGDVARLVQFVDGLSSKPRHHYAGRAFVGLSLGAGARLGDIVGIAVEDWVSTGDGLMVALGRGVGARRVEVTNGWAGWLTDLRRDLVTGDPFQVDADGRRADSAAKSLENFDWRRAEGLSSRERDRLGLRLNFERGRTTWLVERLASSQRLDLLLRDAGLTSASTLDRYLQFLPDSQAPRRRAT